jgi:hypothetical protein
MIAYEENPAECQRLAMSQGYSTVCVQEISDTEQPAFGLYGSTSAAGMWRVGDDGKLLNVSSNTHAPPSAKLSWVQNTAPLSPEDDSHPLDPNSLHEVILVIRGTQSIQDVVTDIRAAPAEFPPPQEEILKAIYGAYSHSLDSTKGALSEICTPSKIGSSQVCDTMERVEEEEKEKGRGY